jgi:uncharacterized metal-binding protein YceD (DUF177 family)
VNTLKIPVTSIGNDGYAFEDRVRVSSIQPPDTKPLPVESVSVSGRFDRLGEEFLFRGHVAGVYEGPCVRCLQPSQMPFDVEVAWVFAEAAGAVFEEIGHALDMEEGDVIDDDPKDAYRPFQGHEINLAPYVWEEVVFAQPSRFLCRDSCKGICPRCGTDKNEGNCQCADVSTEEQVGNRGLAVLADMFPELRPEKTKE